MKLLDTDTCIELLRGNRSVLARRAQQPGERVCTTWTTAAELYYGAAKSRDPLHNRELVARLLASMDVLGLDDSAAQLFGEAKALLEARGTRLADADLLIGAIAIACGAAIVTGNRKHYARIPGVAVEDWIRG